MQENTIVIIIGIETYRNNLPNVKYAQNDANAFKELILKNFEVPESNIKLILDQYASKTALLDEVRYEIAQLKKEENLIFYYAGHGFYQNGFNRLTAWDSNLNFIETSSISIDELLFEPLRKSSCSKSLIFLDTCSENISSNIYSRGLLSPINKNKLKKIVEVSIYSAVFSSCSPGEKSHSNDTLKNGIWTHFLINALKGKYRDAMNKNNLITDFSLQTFLAFKVPEFLKKKTNIQSKQTPFSIISSQEPVIIHSPKINTNGFTSSKDYSEIQKINHEIIHEIISGFRFEWLSLINFDIDTEKVLIFERLHKLTNVNNEYTQIINEKYDNLDEDSASPIELELLASKSHEILSNLYVKYSLPENVYFGDTDFISQEKIEYWESLLECWIDGLCNHDEIIDLLNDVNQQHDLDHIYLFFGLPNKTVDDGIYIDYLVGQIYELGERKIES